MFPPSFYCHHPLYPEPELSRLQQLQYVPKWHILNAPGAVNFCVTVACHSNISPILLITTFITTFNGLITTFLPKGAAAGPLADNTAFLAQAV